jgi:hypothetical protein
MNFENLKIGQIYKNKSYQPLDIIIIVEKSKRQVKIMSLYLREYSNILNKYIVNITKSDWYTKSWNISYKNVNYKDLRIIISKVFK